MASWLQAAHNILNEESSGDNGVKDELRKFNFKAEVMFNYRQL
jgi:hypothetical protein